MQVKILTHTNEPLWKTKISCVYKIENVENGKVYIGSTSNLYRRYIVHKNELKNNSHDNKRLQDDFNKFGSDKFLLSIMKECNFSELEIEEGYFIDMYKSHNIENGYNMSNPRFKGNNYKYMTDEELEIYKNNLSKGQKNRGPVSYSTREKLREKALINKPWKNIEGKIGFDCARSKIYKITCVNGDKCMVATMSGLIDKIYEMYGVKISCKIRDKIGKPLDYRENRLKKLNGLIIEEVE